MSATLRALSPQKGGPNHHRGQGGLESWPCRTLRQVRAVQPTDGLGVPRVEDLRRIPLVRLVLDQPEYKFTTNGVFHTPGKSSVTAEGLSFENGQASTPIETAG